MTVFLYKHMLKIIYVAPSNQSHMNEIHNFMHTAEVVVGSYGNVINTLMF